MPGRGYVGIGRPMDAQDPFGKLIHLQHLWHTINLQSIIENLQNTPQEVIKPSSILNQIYINLNIE